MSTDVRTIEGGCRCGALRFKAEGEPLLSSACHCTGCQRMSGGPYSLTLSVPAEGFSVTKGEPVIGGLKGPDAHHHFCPECLSWVFTTAEGMDFFVNVRTTMLDDPVPFPPFLEVFTSEKLPWAQTTAERRYATQPEMADYDELMAAYRISRA